MTGVLHHPTVLAADATVHAVLAVVPILVTNATTVATASTEKGTSRTGTVIPGM